MKPLRQALCGIGIILMAGLSSLRAQDTAAVLQLGVHPIPDKAQGGLLAREIGRQAVLLAGRQELGTLTRDAALREPFLDKPSASTFDVQCLADDTRTQVTIILTRPGQPGELWKAVATLPRPPHIPFDYLSEVTWAEEFSRRGIADALRQAGIQPVALPWQATAGLPEGVEERLAEWNLLSEFWVLRELHSAIHDHGESPERLSALARAYAQMGASARMLTGPEYAVFTARGLLYAQRLVVKDHASALALRTRAYTRALAGFQASALQDLDAAGKVAPGAAPPWVPLIDQYCHYQTDDLLATAKKTDPLAGVAAQLAVLTVHDMSINAYRMNVAREAVKTTAPCDGVTIADFMCSHSGPGALNSLVDVGPATMANSLHHYLMAMPGVPADVVASASDIDTDDPIPDAAQIGSQLVSADVTPGPEPSWAALGRVIQDITFVHVWRKANLIRDQWGVSADEYVAADLPLIEDHPFKALIASMGKEGPAAFKAFATDDLPKVDISRTGESLYSDVPAPWGRTWWTRCVSQGDSTSLEYDGGIDFQSERRVSNQHVIQDLALSPFSPVGIAARIHTDWDASQAARADWEPRLKNNPLIARAMTLHFQEAKDLDQAAAWGRLWLDGSPDMAAYTTLADIFDHQGKQKESREVLDDFLGKGIAYGLERELVRVTIANRLMTAGDYTAAWPYASDAADSGAAWATLCAMRCADGLRDWTTAEKLVMEVSDHYTQNAADWYLWCQTTGKGDLDAARTFLKRQDAFGQDSSIVYAKVAYDILEGDQAAAATLLEDHLAKGNNPWFGLELALLYDGAGKPADRDRVLKFTAELENKSRNITGGPELARLAQLLQQCLQEKATTRLTTAAIDDLLKPIPGNEADACYFIGRFLELHGRPQDAKTYYTRSVWSVDAHLTTMPLSAARLRALDVDPLTVQPPSQPQPSKPEAPPSPN